MPQAKMQGVFPILVTPFDEQSRIDEESLRNLVEFNVTAGVHGLGIALGSEVFKLSEAERDLATRIVVDQARGRVPIVVNTGSQGTAVAVLYSQAAAENGANALMLIAPSATPTGPPEVREYFRAVSDTVGLPVFIQDVVSAPISAPLALQIAEECERVRYIKVESGFTPTKVVEVVAQASERLTVFGGAGGGYFIEEMRRGSLGTMPFCSQPEAFVEVWRRFREGDESGARAVFDRVIAPINRIAAQAPGAYYHVHKELLRRRGVIRTAIVRHPAGPPLDAPTRRELDAAISELYGLGS